jgi:hypothetical protein
MNNGWVRNSDGRMKERELMPMERRRKTTCSWTLAGNRSG